MAKGKYVDVTTSAAPVHFDEDTKIRSLQLWNTGTAAGGADIDVYVGGTDVDTDTAYGELLKKGERISVPNDDELRLRTASGTARVRVLGTKREGDAF